MNKHTLAKQVGKRIRELREARNLKQYELAELIEIEPTNLSKIENGVYLPREEKLRNIAKVLNVEIKDFYDIGHIMKREDIINAINSIITQVNDNELSYFYKIIKSYKELIK